MIALPDMDDAARVILEQAALHGAYDPREIAAHDGAVDPNLVAQLSDVSEELEEDGRMLWRVRGDARRDILASMAQAGRLGQALGEVQLRPDDLIGRYLVDALSGDRLAQTALPPERREAALVANELAAASLGQVKGKDALKDVVRLNLTDLRSEGLISAEKARSEAILPGELLGRQAEREMLDAYIDQGAVRLDIALDAAAGAAAIAVPPFLLTGTAGSGKSALLADVIRRRRGRDCSGERILLLDFDRPSLCSGGEPEWFSELTRQLGLGRPKLAAAMSRARRLARSQVTVTESQPSAYSAGLLSELLSRQISQALEDCAATSAPLLVVLDTFEEVLVRSNLGGRLSPDETLFGQVLRWASDLSRLRTPSGEPAFKPVRILVSGRSSPELGEHLGDWFCASWSLGGLAVEPAAEFLRLRDKNQRLSATQRRRAAQIVDGHPLSLILLERFVRHASEEVVEDVLAKADLGKILGGEEAARTLYTRFLRRLHVDALEGDAELQRQLRLVAHPGLVLREVSEELLRDVIATGCGIELSAGASRRLLDALTDQVWLVEPVAGRSERTVRHRPDVRRLMLPMMNGSGDRPDRVVRENPDLAHQVIAVRRNAVDWYQARSTSSHDAFAIEAAYHRAFLMDLPDLIDNPALALAVWNLAPADVEAMPLPAMALIRFHARGPSSLSTAQIAALPAGLQQGAADGSVGESLSHGRFMEAASKIESQEDIRLARAVQFDVSPRSLYDLATDTRLATEVNAAFMAGQFYKAASIGWRAIIGMIEGQSLVEPLPFRGDLTSHWIWRAAMARMISGKELPTDDWLEEMGRRLTRSLVRDTHAIDSAGTFLTCAVQLASAGRVRAKADAGTAASVMLRDIKEVRRTDTARMLSITLGWAREGRPSFSLGTRQTLQISRRLIATNRLGDRLSLPLPSEPDVEISRDDPKLVVRLLSERFEELEEVTLAILSPVFEAEPNRILATIAELERGASQWPAEYSADLLSRRIEAIRGSSRILATVILTANERGLLPELIKGIADSGRSVAALSKLTELASRYRHLLVGGEEASESRTMGA